MKKNIGKRIKGFMNRYINGAKGAVSLLLALVMSPLLAISLLLVEYARYQDAVQLMEEIMGASAFSVLADYDSYMDERFGLLSLSQEGNIDAEFSEFLRENAGALGKSVTLNSSHATGKFPLSDTDILKQQLLEYSEVSVITEAITEGIDLDQLLEKLTEALKLKEIKDEIDGVNACAELAAVLEDILENIIKSINHYDKKYEPALNAYESAYTNFENKALKLIDALKTAENELTAEETYDDIYGKSAVVRAINELYDARDKYKQAAETLKTEFSTLKEQIESIMSAAKDLPSKLQKFDSAASNPSLSEKCTTSVYEWVKIVSDQILTTLNSTVGNDFSDKSQDEIDALDAQITKLSNLTDRTITSSWTQSQIESEYGAITITTITSLFRESMNALVDFLNNTAAVSDEGAEKMENLLDIAGELLGISGLYDGNLDAAIDPSCLHTNTSVSYSATFSMNSLTDLLDACRSFGEGITSLNILEAIKGLVKLMKSIAEFFIAILAWVGETVMNLFVFATMGPKEWYNSILLYGYGAYNLPNRTNYNSGNTISGFSYDEIYQLAGGRNQEPTLTGSLDKLSTIGNTAGSARMFKGAEAEYVIVGSPSELMNQSTVFFNLYLIRLALDIGPVLRNAEVSSIAALAGPGAWVVKLAIIIAEPMLDLIILVNGGKTHLIKKTVYLSYSGMVILQQELVGVSGIAENLQEKLKDTIVAKNGDPEKKGLFEASYTEHLMILMLLKVNQETFIQRVQNLIQMETAEKNKGSCAFDLDRAYTYLYTDAQYTLNPMFNIDSLTSGGLFTATSSQYSGY